MEENFEVQKHVLVPKHTLLTEAQKEKLLKELNIQLNQLPVILKKDAAIADLETKENDVIKIERIHSPAGESVYYRRVV